MSTEEVYPGMNSCANGETSKYTFHLERKELLAYGHKTYLYFKGIITILLNIVIGEISTDLLINVFPKET